MGAYYLIYAALTLPVVFSAAGRTMFRTLMTLAFAVVAVHTWGKGAVGTDAGVYLAIIAQVIESGGTGGTVEPGFEVLILGLSRISNHPQTILNMIGCASLVFALIALLRMPWVASAIVFAVYGTYFLVDGAFNVVRLGLALALVLLAYAEYERRKVLWSAILGVLAVSVQFTAALPILIIVLLTVRTVRTKIIVGMAAGAMIVWIYADRLDEKFELYTADIAEKGWSGLAIAAIGGMLLAVEAAGRRGSISKSAVVLVLAILACSLPNDYGHLTTRLGQLLLFALAVLVAMSVERAALPKIGMRVDSVGTGSVRPAFWILLVATAAASSVFRLRNIADVSPTYITPYVPFKWRQE